MNQAKGPHIVVIGGGTGSFVVLSGLKQYARHLTALVSMADDGGSTGQLRDEYGVLPPGDTRQCLVALSTSPRVRELFNYRFDDGTMSGHAFGNLFLTALEKMTGSFAESVALAKDVLRVDGDVVPITLDDIELEAHDGKRIICGESAFLATKLHSRPTIRVKHRNGHGKVRLNPAAKDAIQMADLIVVAPGNLYTSLAPALAVPGIGKLLVRASARVVYVANLINKPNQTEGYFVHDYVAELERIAGAKFIDYVIYNIRRPADELLARYAAEGERPVRVAESALRQAHYKSIGTNLLSCNVWRNQSSADPLAAQRSLIRHNSDAVARAIMKLYFS